jgi:glutamate synthase domain-containing protein 2
MDPSAKSTWKPGVAMNRIGGKSNSGEGGEDPKRFQKTWMETLEIAPSNKLPLAVLGFH